MCILHLQHILNHFNHILNVQKSEVAGGIKEDSVALHPHYNVK